MAQWRGNHDIGYGRRVGLAGRFCFRVRRSMTARPVTARAATNYGPLAQRTMDRWQSEIGPPNRPPPPARAAAQPPPATRHDATLCPASSAN